MNLQAILSAALIVDPSSAFERHWSSLGAVGTFDYPSYTELSGAYNISKFMVLPQDQAPVGINSYFTTYYITGSNGHKYFVLGHAQQTDFVEGAEPSYTARASIQDITAGTYVGQAKVLNGTISTTKLDLDTGRIRVYSTSDDFVSSITTVSTFPGIEFSLTSTMEGPNLFDGGVGSWYWGTDITYQWAAPNGLVNGTLTITNDDGTTEAIEAVTSHSLSWLDRQWGHDINSHSWNLFMIHLSNGAKAAIWNNEPVADSKASSKGQRMATVVYPDGHHEIYPIDAQNNLHGSVPWTSPDTNMTYYGNYQLSIPGANANLTMVAPQLVGETTDAENPTGGVSLTETYVDITGTWGGVEITGYGVSEYHHALASYPGGP